MTQRIKVKHWISRIRWTLRGDNSAFRTILRGGMHWVYRLCTAFSSDGYAYGQTNIQMIMHVHIRTYTWPDGYTYVMRLRIDRYTYVMRLKRSDEYILLTRSSDGLICSLCTARGELHASASTMLPKCNKSSLYNSVTYRRYQHYIITYHNVLNKRYMV